ncbi:MAG TPA: ATP-binding cassette domain-containing protein [Acidimicrobiales bacterium]|nr:ATP-binding cassette domain-containing protein [Acidimicrobiales bacterium]
MALIEAQGLTKVFRRPDKQPGLKGAAKHLVQRRYSEHVAVRGLDLVVDDGEAVAYVGPNGAGKSTTIKMLAGILVPTSGSLQVGGVVPHKERVANARQIGVVFGQRTHLWWDLTLRDSLELLRDMYGLSQRTFEQRLERFDSVLDLSPLLPVVARKLSLGQRMRADLAAALLHAPRVVFLDEPTVGLDIAVKDKVRAFVRQLVKEGTTIMLTTHDLGDIEDICQRLVIIDNGRVVYDGSLEAVKDAFARERTIHFQLAGVVSVAAVRRRLPGLAVAAGERERELTVVFDKTASSAGEVLAAVTAEAEVEDMRISEPAIEDVIRKLYAGELSLESVKAGRP